jgi:dephospho-CoA kinase
MNARTRKLVIAASVVLVVIVAGTLIFRQIPATVSAPLFVLVVIIEVIIAPIPGGAVGYLGAARYGFWQAWPLLYIGNVIGTTLVFFLARRYGTPLFEENVSAKTRARYDRILKSHPFLLWLVYSVPVVPVDVLSVLAGLSRISARRFLSIALSGYIIYTGIVAFVGSTLAQFVGVTEAVSAIGGVFLVVLIWWLWKQQAAASPRELLRVAVTGNIASGKSAVAETWQQQGAVVIDADDLSRRAVQPGSAALKKVIAQFGNNVIAPDGTLDRAALRNVVFNDDMRRKELESILHPEIERLRQNAEREAAGKGARIVVHSIPLLFETGLDELFDIIVLVDAPESVRRERLMATRNLDGAEADAMIRAQMPAELKRKRAHHVIDNAGTLEELKARALDVWRAIEARAP